MKLCNFDNIFFDLNWLLELSGTLYKAYGQLLNLKKKKAKPEPHFPHLKRSNSINTLSILDRINIFFIFKYCTIYGGGAFLLIHK